MAQTQVATKSNLIDDDNVGVLPPDALFEVLLRLPADELCRLRLVCRPWRWLTCDPLFARAHSSRHAHVVALEPRLGEIHVVDLSSGNVVKRIRVGDEEEEDVVTVSMSAQHDLVTLSYGYRRRWVLQTRYEEEELKSLLDLFRRGTAVAKKKNTRVFNLVTGAAAAANALPLEQPPGPPPLLSPPTYILGHVASAGEYKVLRVARQLVVRGDGVFDHAAVSSHVTTLLAAGDDDGATAAPQWRTTARPPLHIAALMKSHFVIGGTMAYFYARNGGPALAVFDFATEQWRPTPLQGPPPVVVDHSGGGGATGLFRLSSLGGRLVGVLSTGEDDDGRESKADLWFLEDDGGTDGPRWTKGYTLRFSPHLEGYELVRPLLVLGDGRIVAYWVPGRAGLGMLNLETGTWTTTATTVNTCYSSVAVCQGSLLCPGIVLNNRFM